MATRLYKKLPGRSHGILNASTLWEADDHLLLVESYRVSESYKRFHYRDIQAIVLCRTKSGLVMNLIFATLTALVAGLAILLGRQEPASGGMLGFVALMLATVTLVGFLRGPTCRCTLRTAVQTQPLPSLTRLRKARKLLLRLQPKIAAAQGQPLA